MADLPPAEPQPTVDRLESVDAVGADPHEPTAAPTRFFFVVARPRMDLFLTIQRQFRGDPTVHVMLDRREHSRRGRSGPIDFPDRRRQPDRRRPLDYWEDTTHHPAVIIPLARFRGTGGDGGPPAEVSLCRGGRSGGGGAPGTAVPATGPFIPPMLLDPEQMIETISNTTGNSVAFQYSAPRILARDFDGIRMDITYKDVELQTSLARSLGMPMFMAPMALQVYQMGRAMGLGDKDGAAIVQLYEQWTGVPVVPRESA